MEFTHHFIRRKGALTDNTGNKLGGCAVLFARLLHLVLGKSAGSKPGVLLIIIQFLILLTSREGS